MLKIKTLRKYFWKITLIAIFIFFVIPSVTSASTIFRAPSVDGLVGYWNFDINAGGSTAYDMSGQANNGTMVNMDPATDWVDGKVGSGALDFDGSNDHINIPDSSNWDLFGSNTGGATLSLWVKHNLWNTTDTYIGQRHDDSNAWWIQHDTSGTMWFGIYTAGFIVQTPAGGAITDTNWHHITMVKNENVYTLSLDGIVAGTVTDDSTAVFTGPLFIGDMPSLPATPVYPFPGLIDDVRIYNRALSAEEIQRLYKTTAGTKIKPTLSNGLVGYWNFDIGAGGSVAYDMSGNAKNGALTNMDPGTDWVDGKVGSGALDFDGVNDYVDMGSQPDLNFTTGNLTIAGWMKIDEVTEGDIETLVSNIKTTLSTGYIFGTYASKVCWYTNAGPSCKFGNTTLSTGVWYHIAVTVGSSGNYIIYLNGINDGSGSGNLPIAGGSTFKIGTYNDSGANGRHDGLIDEVRVYNRALSAEEIQRLYKTTAGTKIKPPLSNGLVGYWNFDIGAGGSTAYDMSGQANNGTLVNMDPATDWVDGKVGSGALDFDGSNDYVTIPDSDNFDFPSDFAIEFWAYLRYQTTGWEIISKRGNGDGSASAYTIVAYSDNGITPNKWVWAGGGVGWAGNYAFGDISLNQWQHIVLTRSGSSVRAYVNAVLGRTETTSATWGGNALPMHIGYNHIGGNWHNGLIDEVRVYNRALSAEEIQRLYDLGNLKP